jgi:hypothetical protein
LPARQAVWETNTLPPFSEMLASVRPHWWQATLSSLSSATPDLVEIPQALFACVIQTLAFAA